MLVGHVVKILDNLLHLIAFEDDSLLEAGLLCVIVVLKPSQVLALVENEAIVDTVLEDVVNPERLDFILWLIEIRLL